MRKLIILTALTAIPYPAQAVICDITDYSILTYEHGGAYISGSIGGRHLQNLSLCGGSGASSGGTTDCASPATDKRLSLALTGQSRHIPLQLEFLDLANCGQVDDYYRPFSIRLGW